jgi:hypothetical protein
MRVQRKYFFGLLYRKQWANIEGAQVHFHLLVMEQWGIMLV